MFAFSSKLPFLFSSLFKSIDPEDVEYKMGTRKPNPFAQRKRSKKLNRPGVADRRNEPYVEIVRENEYFCKYYQAQEICPIDEWQSLLSCLRSDLPTTFRITASKKEAVALSNIVQIKFFDEYCRALTELRNGSEMVEKPISLPWYPKGFAWQLQLSRRDIRRSEPLFKLHNFLIAETNAGNISRQEAVSMIPPIVLEVKPSDKVLDMCAAPGSKTSQLIEALHSANNNDIPSGFVLANDVDNNRCYMLVHQAKRLNSPSLLVTNHDSAFYPNLLQTDTEGRVSFLKFDKILCDVPCSGDGTLRKNPDIWLKWNTDQAYNLHGLQYRILRRGVELLAVGGRIVYSTCSMNPIENEAIIQRIIKDANGALEVIAVKQLLPGLKYVPGLKNWKVISKAGEIFSTMEEVPEKFQTIIRPNMFPLPENEIENIGLERCLRILPHLQNTGGFFVAALEKKQLLPWEKEETFPTIQIQQISGAPARKKCRTQGYKEDPFVFFKDSEDFWDSIQNFYELSDSFDKRCLLTRCIAGKKKNIYVCSNVIRDIIENNEKNVKIVNTGVKTFVRCDNKHMKCAFRLAQEGLNTINAFIGQRRRITLCKEDLLKLLQCTNLTKPPSLTELSKEAQEQAVSLEVGSCVLHYNIDELIISLVGWRGSCSLRAYTDLNDTVHLLRLLDADVTMFDNSKHALCNVSEEAITIQPEAKHYPSSMMICTCEEQCRLEELLVEYPPEPVEMRRFAKIGRTLGNRTTKQIASRIQKYFKKLHSVGMPVPECLPKANSRRGTIDCTNTH